MKTQHGAEKLEAMWELPGTGFGTTSVEVRPPRGQVIIRQGKQTEVCLTATQAMALFDVLVEATAELGPIAAARQKRCERDRAKAKARRAKK